LERIKNNSSLLEYYGKEFVEHMIEILPHIEDKYDRALLIETIMECLDIYTFSQSYLKEIFDEYVLCIAEKAVNVKGMSACLISFLQAGISEKEVIKKLEENLEKEYVISVLSKMYTNYLANSVEAKSTLLKEAQEAYYLSQRSGIIAQFLLLVNPYVQKYAGISQITFLYDSYRGVYEDCWPRGLLPNMKDTLIKSKILSLKEISILEELDSLINMQGKDLDSMEVRKLYDDFFQNKDPFEVIFTLPV
ncbi:hypothetical protein AA984_14545, partial [Brevibacillus formosus]